MYKIFGILILLSYFLLIVLAPLHMFQMKDMDMENCPFSFGVHTLCQMSFVEHVKSWIGFLEKVVISGGIFFNILLASAFVYLTLVYLVASIEYLERGRRKKIFYALQVLYAKGVLNSKIY